MCRTLKRGLRRHCDEVRTAGTARRAISVLRDWQPDLLIIDFRLPDGTAIDVLGSVDGGAPLPRSIAISAYAEPVEAFDLARLGVTTYLTKPVSLSDLDAAIEHTLLEPPNIDPAIRNAVGHFGLKAVEANVRGVMVNEALQRSNGSRRGAARLLSVSRQFLQHTLRR